jgi:hypothetical protein
VLGHSSSCFWYSTMMPSGVISIQEPTPVRVWQLSYGPSPSVRLGHRAASAVSLC